MLLIPSQGPSDWQRLLAEPVKHWKTGFSARSLAHCWEAADGLPPELANLFHRSSQFRGHTPELLLAIPEWEVALPGGTRKSQNDVFALVRCADKIISLTVEGKVNEPFGPTLGDWSSPNTPGKTTRLDFIKKTLGLPEVLPDGLYYQLLHRTASAVIEAERFRANTAAMIVHSFSPERKWFEEYALFVDLMGIKGTKGELEKIELPNGISLHLGWATGNPKFLLS